MREPTTTKVKTERLSNAATSLIRFVLFPLVVVASLGTTAVMVATASSSYALYLIAIVPLLYVTGSQLWRCRRVVAMDDGLHVDTDRVVPYREIERVTTFRYSNPEMVIVWLATGESIRFLARQRTGFGFSEHPVAEWLRERAKR
jgi:hypothetical protein